MKIAIISDRVNPMYVGGYEYLIFNLSQKLAQNHDVTIFTSMNESDLKINNVKYMKISKMYKYVNHQGIHNLRESMMFSISFFNIVRKLDNYDVVILSTIPYLFFGRILDKIKVKKISIFYEAWYSYLVDKPFYLRLFLKHEIGRIVKKSNFLVSISSPTTNSLIKNYNAKQVYTIPIGINTEINEHFSKKIYDVIYLGRLATIKHVEDLIKSAVLLMDRFPDIRIAIAGDGNESQKLQDLSNEYNLNKNIEFLGKVNDDKKYYLLSSSKLFVLPSEREGFSISTLEAMYCGAVPIVAKPKYEEIFGVSDFVVDGVTGLYYKFSDIKELEEKISYLLENFSVYNELRSNAINSAKKYDWNRVIHMYNEVLNAL